MVYISSLLSDGAFDPRYHKTFKTTSIPEHIKQRIRRRCVKRSSVRLHREYVPSFFNLDPIHSQLTSEFIDISLSSSEDPPPPLTEILFAKRPYLKDELEEHGKCDGLGPSSVTETLEPASGGDPLIPSHDRLALERLTFCARGLLYQLKNPKVIFPRRKAELRGRRVTDSIASRMEEDFVRGLGIAEPIEPLTKEELFQLMIEALWIWLQDARCKMKTR
ncbi:uncharacterized protein MELLADRAFT_64833 [Melampsora larici-populina 98AG31]|uniref:Uncharacterized protein n=1 Tax=Melampsora larici-populina (strain 98AG31 / pathotype 3-4-7) TaxID=747676 RepID=F4RSZ3_MELLP|nr:uncharacterized protein MELLADRAFT_64833 [Melampsora larici-populina 98AG31]EGG04519.1 hypothetical protein MELLADRAFT_64833 [Melampsora larici-populina 98AG31]